MRSKQIRFLITFVAAMFLANNVAAAARAYIEGLNGQDVVASQALNATGVGHSASVTDDETPCLAHCAQGYKHPEQKLATNATEGVSIPALFVSFPSLKIKPAASVIALPPQAAGPPLTILFHNLRN
jgi:hypothetical protein